jgi:hypothetical protein
MSVVNQGYFLCVEFHQSGDGGFLPQGHYQPQGVYN